MSATPHRRLSARRGSTSALDPYALHADINENPNRSSSSKLTIVRVLPQQHSPATQTISLNEAPAAFTSRNNRRRFGGSATSPPHAGADSPPPGRLSFAFSSFGPSDGGGPSSPSSSPRIRPSSPRLATTGGHYQPSQYSIGKPRLTPEQLVDLARQATNPRTLAQIANAAPSPSSPAPASAGGSSRPPSVHLPSNVSTNVMPATFTPLPDDIYLPFVDRPSEVAQLISTPPDAKLFALLAQTLPKSEEDVDLSKSTSSDQSTQMVLPRDPSVWTYSHLIYHLTQVDRDVAPDPIWAFAARKCILSHSELIWERVKGAFGVPPELDIDYDFTRTRKHRSSSVEKREAGMRKLRAALREGAPKPKLGKPAGENESAIDSDEDEEESDEEIADPWANWDAALETPAHLKPVHGTQPAASSTDQRRDSVHNVGGVVIGSFNDPSSSIGIATQGPSPPLGATSSLDGGLDDADFISIEPLLAPSPEAAGELSSNPPPPLSQAASALLATGEADDTPAAEGIGLGDIAEGEEEEEEEGANDIASEKPAEPAQEPEEEVIDPAQIQGLRILTSPVHAAGSYGVGGLFVPHHTHPFQGGAPSGTSNTPPLLSSPLPQGEDHTLEPRTLNQALTSGIDIPGSKHSQGSHVISPPSGGRTHSRTSSFSSVTGVTIGPFSRSESTGNVAALMSHQRTYSSSEAGDSTGYGSDWSVGATGGGSAAGSVVGHGGQEVVGDRLPGQPLFVSNFARLNGCPTLKGPGGPGSSSTVGRSNPSRFKLSRKGSTGASMVGTVPSSSFLGSHAVGKPGSLESERVKARTYSHGSYQA